MRTSYYNLQARFLWIADQHIISKTFVISNLLILVCDGNTYKLIVQNISFQKLSPIASLRKCVLQICSRFTKGDPAEMWFQRKLRNFSAWVLYCKFVGDLQNTFLEEHLWVTGFVFYNISFGASNNNTFYWLAFIIYRPEFGDWSKIFLKVFFILWSIFRIFLKCLLYMNNWSTYYIFTSIFSQRNVHCNCRSSTPQLFFKKDNLIYTRYKREEEWLHK